MSHGDSITRLPRRLPLDRPDRLVAVRRPRGPRPQPVRDPVPPRGRPHAARPRRPAQLRRRDRRRHADLDAGQLHRADRRRDPGPGRRACRRDRLGRARHLRPVRRRGLGRRRRARPPRRRRSADVHLRRPRPDAEEGVGAAPRHLRARPRHAPASWSTPASGSCAGWPGVEDPEQKRKIIGDEFIRVFEEEARQARPDRLPDPGHALPGRHRERDVRDEGRPEDQDPPQRRRAAGGPPVPADRAAALPVQGRGPGGRAGARPARGDGPPPAVPGAGPRDPDHRRGHRRAARHAPRGRLDRHRRDQGGRAVPIALAVASRS